MRYSTKHKIKTHLAACALAGIAFSGSALGAIQCRNTPISFTSSTDLYINLVTGASGSSGGGVSGWDINPYPSTSGFAVYWGGTGTTRGGVADTASGPFTVLAAGATIGPSSTYAIVATGADGMYPFYVPNGVTNAYLGVKFPNETLSGSPINYGWISLTTTGAASPTSGAGFPATINEWCWQDDGSAIAAGDTGAPPPEADFGFSTSSLDFGNVTVGGSSAPQSVTIGNFGDAVGTISGLDTGHAAYAITGGSCGATPFDLDPSETCTIAVTFTPSVAGTAEGSLTFSTGGGQAVVVGIATSVELNGNGVAGDPGPGPGGAEPVVANVPVNSPWALAALLGLFGLIAGAMLRRR